MKFLSLVWIESLQYLMQVLGSSLLMDFRDSLAQHLVGWRTGKKRLTQRPKVKACSTYQNRYATARLDRFDFFDRLSCPVSRREIEMRRNKINQVMWHTSSFFRRHLRGG